jgi:Flp pilus assembly protein TadD
MEQPDEAIHELQTGARLKPDQAEAHRNLSHALLQQGRLDEAIHEFQEVLKLKPDDRQASNDLVLAIGMKEKQPQPDVPSSNP